MSATVSPPFSNCEVRRHPDDVAQVGRRLDVDLRQARERHPVVAAVDDRFEHRAEARVGVGDPVERLAVDVARRRPAPPRRRARRSSLRSLALAAARRRAATRSAAPATGPARRRSSATSCPSKTSSRIASQRTASPYICAIASALGVEVRRDLQLVERALPLPEHAEQLEQEDAQLGDRPASARTCSCSCASARGGIAVPQALFGGIGEAHGVHPRCDVQADSVRPGRSTGPRTSCRPAAARPCPAACTRPSILLNEKLTRSTTSAPPLASPPSTVSDDDAAVLDRDLQVLELASCRPSAASARPSGSARWSAAPPSAPSTRCRPA